jgi:hypothetical protein
MKIVQPKPSRILRISSLILIALFAAVAFCAHAEERATLKSSHMQKYSQDEKVKKPQTGKIQLFKRANQNSKACAKSSSNQGSINSLTLSGGVKSCSGIQNCNDFIVECISAGGEFYPDEDKDDPNTGAPTAGACVTSGC